MSISATALAVAVAGAAGTGYLVGRWRPWARLSEWACDQVRFGGTARAAVVAAAFALTAPATAWRLWRHPPVTEERVAPPQPDPNWVAQRARGHQGGAA